MGISRADLDAGRVDPGDIADPEGVGVDPIHPGLILREEWIAPLGLSV